jgi:hypothetical protein
LPPPNDGVHVKWVEFQSVASPTGTFGRDDCSPRTEKRIEDKISSGRAVLDGIGDHRNGLWGRVESEEVPFV